MNFQGGGVSAHVIDSLFSLQNIDEIEVILRVKTDTWVGVGWRPDGNLFVA